VSHTIPLAEAKRNLSAIIREVEETFDRYTITKNGVSTAILLSSEEFESLLETLDILSNKEELEAIARAKKQVQKGETVSLDVVKKRYNLK